MGNLFVGSFPKCLLRPYHVQTLESVLNVADLVPDLRLFTLVRKIDNKTDNNIME